MDIKIIALPPPENDMPPEVGEKLDVLQDVVEEHMDDMIRLTCVVYLRNQCYQCIGRRVSSRYGDFLREHSHILVDDSFQQFIRQSVVWAREQSEIELKTPCEKENESE